MHQADEADTIGRAATSGGKFDKVSALTRRGVMLGGVAAGAALASLPAVAAIPWDARDWLARWHRLGCGAHGTMPGHPELTPRLADAEQNRAVALMLAEVSVDPVRLVRLGEALRAHGAAMDDLDPERRALRGLQSRIRTALPPSPLAKKNLTANDAADWIGWSGAALKVYEREVWA